MWRPNLEYMARKNTVSIQYRMSGCEQTLSSYSALRWTHTQQSDNKSLQETGEPTLIISTILTMNLNNLNTILRLSVS